MLVIVEMSEWHASDKDKLATEEVIVEGQ